MIQTTTPATPRFVSFSLKFTLLLMLIIGFAGVLSTPREVRAEAPVIETAESSPPVLVLDDPGTGELKTLRYRLKKGQTSFMKMEMTMAMTMKMQGMAMPKMNMPTMIMGADLKVTNVAANGDLTYSMEFTEMKIAKSGADPQVIAAMEAVAKDFSGLKGSATISNRGLVVKSELDMSSITNPQLKQMMGSLQTSMEQVSMPLPEKPVGVGAKWTVTQKMEMNGIQLTQVSHQEIKAIDGDKITTTITVTQSAAAQEIKSPDLPSGTTATLKTLTSTGSGDIVFSLKKLVPHSKMKVSTSTDMIVEAGGSSQEMSVGVDIDVVISPGR